jgi:hypothetical protein
MYRAIAGSSTLLAELRPAQGEVRICDASAWLADDLATARSIKVGDAALARDPLSSQGVLAAVRAAPGAAATVHAILSGGDGQTAIAQYAAALRDSARHHVMAAAEFYAAGCWRDSVFWRQRSEPRRWFATSMDEGLPQTRQAAGRGAEAAP